MRLLPLLVAGTLLGSTSALGQAASSLPASPTDVPPIWQTTTPPPTAQSGRTPTPQAPAPAKNVTASVQRTGDGRQNIRLELAITDTYAGTPSQKTVSMLVLDGHSGMIRTRNNLAGHLVQLNIDTAARILTGGIQVQVTFEYTPAQTGLSEAMQKGLATAPVPAELHESFVVMLQSGKPLMVSQSADPATDRKVTVELTATILD